MIQTIFVQQKRYCHRQHICYIHLLHFAPQIFTYGTASDPLSQSHYQSSESNLPKGNPTPFNNPPNPVPDMPAYLDSDPSQSDSSLSGSSHSPNDNNYKRRQCANNNKNKLRNKTCFHDPIKKCANLKAKVIISAYKSKVIKFKLDEDPLQRQVYLLSFMIYLKIVYHNLRELRCCLWTIHS